MLEIKNLSYWYSNNKKVLDDISFTVENSCILSLLGSNGTGKTTLLKSINNIISPKSGEVLIDGINVSSLTPSKRAKLIGYVPQYNNSVFPITVIDAVMMGRMGFCNKNITSDDKDIVFDIIEKMELSEFAFKYINEMSGGERQRVFIARALAQEPKVIILDEPTSSLDMKNQLLTLEIIAKISKEKELSVIMSIHDLNLASLFSDKILVLNKGNIYNIGTSNEVLTSSMINDVYNVNASVTTYDGYKYVRLKKFAEN